MLFPDDKWHSLRLEKKSPKCHHKYWGKVIHLFELGYWQKYTQGNFYQEETLRQKGHLKQRATRLCIYLPSSGFRFLQDTTIWQLAKLAIEYKEHCHPLPLLPGPFGYHSMFCYTRLCWLQSPVLCDALTCIAEVEESVPCGFEVSSREKGESYVISLNNYFHYKKIPYLFFLFLKLH